MFFQFGSSARELRVWHCEDWFHVGAVLCIQPVVIDGIRYRMLDSELLFEVYSSWSTRDSKDEL